MHVASVMVSRDPLPTTTSCSTLLSAPPTRAELCTSACFVPAGPGRPKWVMPHLNALSAITPCPPRLRESLTDLAGRVFSQQLDTTSRSGGLARRRTRDAPSRLLSKTHNSLVDGNFSGVETFPCSSTPRRSPPPHRSRGPAGSPPVAQRASCWAKRSGAATVPGESTRQLRALVRSTTLVEASRRAR